MNKPAGSTALTSCCAGCPTRLTGICAPWRTEELNPIPAIRGPARMLSARAELYRQGESCAHYFVLQSGWIALRVMLEAGSWHIADFALPGMLLGMQPVSGLAMSHSAICLTDV